MPWNEGKKTFIAGEALEAHRRVKIKANTITTPPEVEYSAAGENFIGVTEYAVKAGANVAVKLLSAAGTFEVECTVSEAIACGAVLYGANDGKVSDASSGTAQGMALQAAGDSNEHIEVLFWHVTPTDL